MQHTIREFLGQLVARHVQRIGIARDQHHVGAETQQLTGDGQADAGAGTGHQCALSVQGPALRSHARLRCVGSGVG